jgi:hypothetical protein
VSNSKYRNKQKQSKPKVYRQPEVAFTYTCTCHGERSTKKACLKGNGEPDDKGFFQSPLGTWTCPITRQKCKVSRTKVKKEEPVAEPFLTIPEPVETEAASGN